jgi:HK97 family phage portal protein
MFTIPLGWDVQPLNMKLADSQFYELKKYNALQIAAAFGLSPDHLNDYTKSSYNNSAMQNLQFYVNTLLYNITIYEQEMNRKLLTRREQDEGLGYKFNVWTILRGDPQQQADVLQKMAQSAIYSVNEARNKLDLPPCENGDVHMVNGSYVKLEEIGKAYAKGSENNVENQEQE